jgi:shikimate dehydrogenase
VLAADGGWVGYNTDGPAALACIRRAIDPNGCRVAVLGAGGTARAVAVSLAGAGSRVTLFNRTEGHARDAAERIGVDWAPVGELADARWEILVNATPQGRDGQRFLAAERLTGKVVLDAVYAPRSTLLAQDARVRGLHVIDGLQMLVTQAQLQFRCMTGRDGRWETMRRAAVGWLASRQA